MPLNWHIHAPKRRGSQLTPKKRVSVRVDAPYRGINSYWCLSTPKKGVNKSWHLPKWACTSIEDQERGVNDHKEPLTPFEACWSRTRASPFFNKLFRAQIHVFFCILNFFPHFEGFRILWCFWNLKILRSTIIISMVHLFFHQFFWVSNWNIFGESKIYSYTLKGEEFNGKVWFSHKQNPFNFFGTTSSFLWVSHQKKWKEFFLKK